MWDADHAFSGKGRTVSKMRRYSILAILVVLVGGATRAQAGWIANSMLYPQIAYTATMKVDKPNAATTVITIDAPSGSTFGIYTQSAVVPQITAVGSLHAVATVVSGVVQSGSLDVQVTSATDSNAIGRWFYSLRAFEIIATVKRKIELAFASQPVPGKAPLMPEKPLPYGMTVFWSGAGTPGFLSDFTSGGTVNVSGNVAYVPLPLAAQGGCVLLGFCFMAVRRRASWSSALKSS